MRNKFFRCLAVAALCATALVSCDLLDDSADFEGDFKVKSTLVKADYTSLSIDLLEKYTDAPTFKIGAFISRDGVPGPENKVSEVSTPVDASNGAKNQKLSFVVERLNVATTYKVRPYIYNNATREYIYGDVVSMTTSDVTAGDAIDLGLSCKWARCNIGAKSPEQAGSLFAYGEIQPRTDFTKENYLYNDGSLEGREIAGTGYDAAHMVMGGKWTLPSIGAIHELTGDKTLHYNNTYYKDVKGVLIVSKSNHNAIFCPCVQTESLIGYYHTAYFWGDKSTSYVEYTNPYVCDPAYGLPVRGVIPNK